ncbi:FK506-binding protein 5 [Cinnamomum micranthum f. kanehirae]|uniref:FK506-binding protein 5 n=1 Tax=Cinnamomum micranthum f. kanehirae TaxID=337451 RepID=A0A3S3M263_9MAGN|nr:FK506-binding protein 5 [Cinnamomum micranthum f. kanehirae]
MRSNPLKNLALDSVWDALDSLLPEIFINRHRHNSNGSNINLPTTVLTPSLPLISSSPNTRGESGLGCVAKEGVKIEGEIIRIILSSDTDSLRPNSVQPIPIYGHNICIRFHNERGSEHWVWECHGHVMTYDENNSLSLEYIFGIYFERRRGYQGI